MDITIQHYILALVFTYIPMHLFEEARGNFPQWMQEHNYMKERLSYGYWLAGNVFFFFPLLILGAITFEFGGRNFLFAGMAVFLWGFGNFCEHVFFTIKDKQISPGLYTGILFAIIVALGIKKCTEMPLALYDFLLAIPLTIVFFGLPIVLQKYVGPKLWKNLID